MRLACALSTVYAPAGTGAVEAAGTAFCSSETAMTGAMADKNSRAARAGMENFMMGFLECVTGIFSSRRGSRHSDTATHRKTSCFGLNLARDRHRLVRS